MAPCNPDEFQTCGGFSANSPKVILTGSFPAEDNERDWVIQAYNTEIIEHLISAFVKCAHVVP